MEKDNFIKNKNIKYKENFKLRRIVNGVTTAAILAGCVAIGATIPLFLPSIGGALVASGSALIAAMGGALQAARAAMTTFGIIKACLIGGAIGAALGGVGSFIKHKSFDYSIIKDENKALKENKSLAKSLEKMDNKLEKVDNDKNQVEVSSPQEINKNAENEEELAR